MKLVVCDNKKIIYLSRRKKIKPVKESPGLALTILAHQEEVRAIKKRSRLLKVVVHDKVGVQSNMI